MPHLSAHIVAECEEGYVNGDDGHVHVALEVQGARCRGELTMSRTAADDLVRRLDVTSETRHVIEFPEGNLERGGWFVEHTYACRVSPEGMPGCEVHRLAPNLGNYLDGSWPNGWPDAGRYWVEAVDHPNGVRGMRRLRVEPVT